MDDSSADVPESTVANMMTKRQCNGPVSRRCASKDEGLFLPIDVISSILCHLPASFLYENCRFACRAWEEMLRCPKFVNSHLSHTHPSTFLVHNSKFIPGLTKTQLVGIRDDWNNMEIAAMNLQVPGSVLSSSDGVLLIQNRDNMQYYIANPVTRQVLKLPETTGFRPFVGFSGIARIPNTGELKVALYSMDPKDVFVTTVGDGVVWRRLVSPPGFDPCQASNFGTSLGGVVYSTVLRGGDSNSSSAVDLRDESVHRVMLPPTARGGNHQLVVSNKDSLYVMDVDQIPKGFLRLWLLKDLHRREWVRVQDLSISPIGLRCLLMRPLIWLESEHVLVVRSRIPHLERTEDGTPQSFKTVILSLCLRSRQYKILAESSESRMNLIRALRHTNSLVRF